jgi:gamma-glutamylcyclotransferase (GGCT)/AIG2-like uncharacterized protein YtfP
MTSESPLVGGAMRAPQRLDLPFFAYGVFKPGQLGFHQLADLVSSHTRASLDGELYIRDGLPLLVLGGESQVHGDVLSFTSPEDAYARIAAMEPQTQYTWNEVEIGMLRANVLVGRKPLRGSERADEEWDGSHDPLFTTALDVVRETTAHHAAFSHDLRPMFHLEMAYLLLWSSIERYLSLRYDLSDQVNRKVQHLAAELAFQAKLRELSPPQEEVSRADDPAKKAVLSDNPKKAVDYYYRIRCNISHRGKGVHRDHKRVLAALQQLTPLFEAVLDDAFGDRRRSDNDETPNPSLQRRQGWPSAIPVAAELERSQGER